MIVHIKPFLAAITLTTLTALCVSCQQVDFGGGCGEINGYSFADMDSNKDGNIRATEFKGGMQTKALAADFRVQACAPRGGDFKQVDDDSDGNITETEFNKYGS